MNLLDYDPLGPGIDIIPHVIPFPLGLSAIPGVGDLLCLDVGAFADISMAVFVMVSLCMDTNSSPVLSFDPQGGPDLSFSAGLSDVLDFEEDANPVLLMDVGAEVCG